MELEPTGKVEVPPGTIRSTTVSESVTTLVCYQNDVSSGYLANPK